MPPLYVVCRYVMSDWGATHSTSMNEGQSISNYLTWVVRPMFCMVLNI